MIEPSSVRFGRGRRDRTGRRRALRAARLVAAGLGLAVALGGCGFAASTGVATTPSPMVLPSVPPSIALTASQLESALRAAGFGLIRPQTPFRPGESPALIGAPRAVYQAVLANDPDHGYIVVYDFADAATAFGAGQEMAAYLASGPGRVQFPLDARHVLRAVGPTLVFFSWSPETARDPRTGEVATALEGLGQGIPVPR